MSRCQDIACGLVKTATLCTQGFFTGLQGLNRTVPSVCAELHATVRETHWHLSPVPKYHLILEGGSVLCSRQSAVATA